MPAAATIRRRAGLDLTRAAVDRDRVAYVRWLVLACCACAPSPAAPSPPAAPALLAPGAYPVGFRATWTFDASRRYRTAFDDGRTYGGAAGAPRPLLINLWYPATRGGPPTSRAAYLQPPDAPAVQALASALAAYVRGVTASEAYGADEKDLSPALRQRFAAYLARPLTAVRDAPPARGPFPVVIYNAGAGSSYGDNVELCEYLASHGYVVLGSAFLDPDGDALAPSEGWTDYDAMLAWARQLPFADPARAGGVGHSLGAQQMLKYAGHGGQRLRTFVLLDTTMDYHGVVEPVHAMIPEVLAQRTQITGTLLAVSDFHAVFAALDLLDRADRTYVTVRALGHDEYLGHGVERATLPDAPAARGPRVRAAYRAVMAAVLAFLDRELRGDADRLAALAAQPISGVAPHLEHVARGVTGPPPYDPTGAAPPSPRQLRALLALPPDAVIEILRAHRAADPDSPVYASPELACSLLYELFASDEHEAASALFGYFHALHADLIEHLLLWGKLADLFHQARAAHLYGAAALRFAPDDAAARAFVSAHP